MDTFKLKTFLMLIAAVSLLLLSGYLFFGESLKDFFKPKLLPNIVKIDYFDIDCDGKRLRVDVVSRRELNMNTGKENFIDFPYLWEDSCDNFRIDAHINDIYGISGYDLEIYCGGQNLEWNGLSFMIRYGCQNEKVKVVFNK